MVTHHEGAEVESEVHGVVEASLMEEENVGNNLRAECLFHSSLVNRFHVRPREPEHPTSHGPAPNPFKTQAPIKLPYVVALARQMLDAKHTREEKIKTGRRPNVSEMGIQKKLLNPRIKMHTPVNCTTEARSELKAPIRSPNIGASAKGPMPMMNMFDIAIKMVVNFQYLFQF